MQISTVWRVESTINFSKRIKQMEAIKLVLITLTAFIVIVLAGVAIIAGMVLIGTPA